MTCDIVMRGCRCPTSREYEISLRLLREVEAAKDRGGLSAWRAMSLTDDEHEPWIANWRAGLLANRPDGAWNVIVLTPLGRRYLDERKVA